MVYVKVLRLFCSSCCSISFTPIFSVYVNANLFKVLEILLSVFTVSSSFYSCIPLIDVVRKLYSNSRFYRSAFYH